MVGFRLEPPPRRTAPVPVPVAGAAARSAPPADGVDAGREGSAARRAASTARVDILGIGFDPMTMPQLVERIERDVERGDRFRIAFSNPEFVLAARREPFLRDYLAAVRYNLADGVGVLWAARRFGTPLPERVTGTDFTDALAALCARRGWSVYLLGGRPGVAERARRRLERLHPGLEVAGVHHGFFEDDAPVLADIARCRPTFLMVCLGNPRQERWIARHAESLPVRVAFGNGGAIDFSAGEVARAPLWMRAHSLEWLHRLANDFRPARLCRQLRLVGFVTRVLARRTPQGAVAAQSR